MKKQFLTLIALMGSALCVTAQSDTIAHVIAPHQVVLTKSDSTLQLNIVGAKDHPDYRFHYTQPLQSDNAFIERRATSWDFSLIAPFGASKKAKQRKHHRFSFNVRPYFLVGFNNLVNPEGNMGTIWGSNFDAELGFLSFDYTHGRHELSLRWGYGWTRYRLDGTQMFNFDLERVTIGAYPEGSTPSRSVFRLNRHAFPLVYTYRAGHGWNFSAGAILNVNVRPRIYNTYYVDGKRVQDTYKDNVPYKPVTTALYAAIKKDDIGFFVRYQPTSLFREGYGPQFNTLTMGLGLNL